MTVARVLVRGPDEGGSTAWPVVALVGEVDLDNVDEVGRAVEDAVTSRAMGLVLDLSEVSYLDSTGLRLVFQLARELGDREQDLTLVVPPTARIRRVLELAGVPGALRIITGVDLIASEEGSS